MPQLIQTPEHWFRTKKTDIYYFRPTTADNEDVSDDEDVVPDRNADFDRTLPDELLAWFKSHLPHRTLELMAPSEYSGWISGGSGEWVMALDANDLDVFVNAWEDSNGKSIDARFQCYVRPYSQWLARVSQIRVSKAPPLPSVSVYRWVISKSGTFWITSESSEDETATYQAITLDDLWCVQQSFPLIHLGVGEVVLAGDVHVRGDKQSCVFDYFQFEQDDFSYHFANFDEAEKLAFSLQIRDALGLSPDAQVNEFSF